MRKLGKNINLARRRRGLSFKDLHEKAGIPLDRVSQITSGYSTITLADLASVLLSLELIDTLASLACPEQDPLGPIRDDEVVPARVHQKKNSQDS